MLGNANPFPLSVKNLDQRVGNARIKDFLYMRADRDYSVERHDFNTTIAADVTNKWTVAATSTATTWAVLAGVGGWIRGVTGASVATGALQLFQPNKNWNGTSGAGFASLIQLSAVTEVRLEQGFADVLPAIGTTCINSLASATFNSVASGAVYVYDHTGSTTTSGLYTIGTSVAAAKVATTTNRYASGTTLFVAVEVFGSNVTVWVGDGDTPLTKATAAISPGDGLLPFVAIKTSAASKNIDIDTVWTWTAGRV